jgi:hypothetical protein
MGAVRVVGWAVSELKGPDIYLGFIEDKMLGMWAQWASSFSSVTSVNQG